MFCPLPWIGYSIRTNGDVRACCHANQGPTNGILLKEDDTPFSYRDSIRASRNSKTLNDIRLTILNGEWHPECIRCKREQSSGLASRNVNETNLWKPHFTEEDARNITNSTGMIDTTEVPLLYFDLRFGNICNLKCRMCYSTESSAWYRDHEYVHGTKLFYDAGKYIEINDGKVENSPYNWYKEPRFWNDLAKYKENMKLVYIVGGEPLLVHEHYDFLEDCANTGYSKNIKIEYNTNLTFLPERAISVWSRFNEVRFGVSIDGVGKVNDYIRHPSKFDKIAENLRFLDESASNYEIWIACTVSAYNILHLPEFMKWKIQQRFKRVNNNKWKPLLTTHPIHKPEHLNVKVFPIESKKIIETRLKESIMEIYDVIDEVKPLYQKELKMEVVKILTGYIKYMFQDDYSEYVERFWKMNNKMDKLWNRNLADYIPELVELIK